MSHGKNSVSAALGSNVRFTTASPDAVRTAAVKPAPVNSLKRSSAFTSASAFFGSKLCRISPVRSITICVAIGYPPLQGTGILRAVSPNAQTQLRSVRGKLTVSRGSSIIIGMHPGVRRDFPRFGQLDHVDWRLVAARSARSASEQSFKFPDRRIARTTKLLPLLGNSISLNLLALDGSVAPFRLV